MSSARSVTAPRGDRNNTSSGSKQHANGTGVESPGSQLRDSLGNTLPTNRPELHELDRVVGGSDTNSNDGYGDALNRGDAIGHGMPPLSTDNLEALAVAAATVDAPDEALCVDDGPDVHTDLTAGRLEMSPRFHLSHSQSSAQPTASVAPGTQLERAIPSSGAGGRTAHAAAAFTTP